MRLDRLVVTGLRNLHGESAEVALQWLPHGRFNLLVGDNGQGKTNLLEAVAILAGLKSFRTAKLQQCIAFGQAQATISGQVLCKGVSSQLGIEIGAKGRKMLVDGKPVTSAQAFLGQLTAVVFTPGDLGLPHAEPDTRRRWLDRVVFNHQPAHLDELRRYDQVLHAKNALLKHAQTGKAKADPAMLDVYDAMLAKHGALVMQRRAAVVQQFSPLVAEVFDRIAAPGLHADVHYRPKIGGEDPEAALLAAQAQRRLRDLRIGYTTGGPHRDDVDLRVAQVPAHLHASQGQCRALVLACKIAEIKSLERAHGEPPVLLMDDVSSELDAKRNAALMHYLDELGGQVVLTTTSAEHVRVAATRQVFHVVGGQVRPGLVLSGGPVSVRGSQPTLAFAPATKANEDQT